MAKGFMVKHKEPIIDTNVYLYKEGEEYTTLTGGWSSTGYTLTGGFTTVAPTKNADSILVNAATGQACFAGTANTINLTDYTTLKCEITLTKNTTANDVVFMGVGTTKGTVWTNYDGRIFGAGTNGNTYTLSLAVSSLNKSDYVYLCAYADNGFILKKVWLEV